MHEMSDLSGRTFVVTGANTGIGKETAAALAARGGRVVLACRSEEKTRPVIEEIARDTGNDALEFVALDLASLASVRACADVLLARDEPIHVLINNAGLAGKQGMTQDGFEMAFGTNHIGHFALTTLLLERLRDSGPARVVTVSSDSHPGAKGIDWDAVRAPTRSRTGFSEYAVSKLANVLFSQELARRTEGQGITTYALHPGVIASDVWRQVPWPVRPVMKLFMKSAADGAQTSVHCATAPDLVDHSGRYYDNCAEKPASAVATPELGRELWERSEAWVSAV
jgi:NAD(P)-dependent dehydrogenase (short-subunit alcohol dehydrogenase family)